MRKAYLYLVCLFALWWLAPLQAQTLPVQPQAISIQSPTVATQAASTQPASNQAEADQTQAVPIANGDTHAMDCYQSSLEANSTGNALFSDLESCDKALEIGYLRASDLIATYVNRGSIYVVLGNISKAEEDYSRALELDPGRAAVYLNRGNLRFFAGQFERAIADYNKAEELEVQPMHILHMNRGMAYEYLDQLAEAEANYMAALELAYNWPPALEKLERVVLKRLEQGSSQQEPSQQNAPQQEPLQQNFATPDLNEASASDGQPGL